MNFIPILTFAWAILMLAGCAKSDDEGPAETEEAVQAPAKPGVTLDAVTQARLGLIIESPTPAQWQPGIQATGRAANPLAFLVSATDYETARTAAAASQAEFERTQKLAAQENASPRALEVARAAAEHDALALQAAQAKFTIDWGPRLAGRTNLTAFASELQAGGLSLVKLFLPVGVFPQALPRTATIYPLGDETNAIAADLADNLKIDPRTQVQTLLFSVKKELPPDVSVTAHLQLPGEAIGGLVVPAGAVVRYEGRGWVYVQTNTNQFVRAEIPLDRLSGTGWFVSENLSATNRIVVTGAESVLSAELGGGFTTGERD
ncbi:MAG TPA: hypothetical protein VL970_15410 [Candidatus Acidoferrales bacterium]|nr:hypothetical protein [Candidatus Acidoferrales bacterium]